MFLQYFIVFTPKVNFKNNVDYFFLKFYLEEVFKKASTSISVMYSLITNSNMVQSNKVIFCLKL